MKNILKIYIPIFPYLINLQKILIKTYPILNYTNIIKIIELKIYINKEYWTQPCQYILRI